MKKLTYWVSHMLTDSRVYSFRARTRREVADWLNEPSEREYRAENCSRPCKVTVEYRDALDLLQQCCGEGGLSEEAMSYYHLPEKK